MAHKNLKICLIAGEASGDALGAKLMKALVEQAEDTSLTFIGVGGQRMSALGLQSFFPMEELSIIGWMEIIPHIPKLLGRINQTVNEILQEKPDIVITIDAPAFNFRVAKKLKNHGIKLVHYVAPTVWAYKPKRAKKIANLYDHLLLLLPFEKPYFDAVNLPSTFVGHPIIEEKLIDGHGMEFRHKHNISNDALLLCAMVGSRNNEVTKLLPIYKESFELLKKKHPDLNLVFVTTPRFENHIKQEMGNVNIPVSVVSSPQDKQDAYAASDICLAKSGTGTFEPAIAGLPMVICYKVNPLSAWMLRRMIQTEYVNLINIIEDKEVIPELLQEECTAHRITQELTRLIEDKHACDTQKRHVHHAVTQLTLNDSPSNMAAKTILRLLED